MFKPEIWLSALAILVFIPMTLILGENPSFDLWRFSLMFTVLIGGIFFYAYMGMR
jgi:MFS-type transporter involved in bile tolerance (Atg22 family)